MHEAKGDYDKACAFYVKAYQQNPRFARALYMLAACENKRGKGVLRSKLFVCRKL